MQRMLIKTLAVNAFLLFFASVSYGQLCSIWKATTANEIDTSITAACAAGGGVIKIAVGTYTFDNPIILCSDITLEGGYDTTFTTKTSTPGSTTIFRSNLNPAGTVGQQRIVGIEVNTESNFRLQDITIQTDNATSDGMSVYGVHITSCSDFNFTRTQVLPGNAAAGTLGTAGTNGSAGFGGGGGSAGANDNDTAPGVGGAGAAGAGTGAGAGGSGAITTGCPNAVGVTGGAGTAPSNSWAGGGGGGGGSGGCEERPGGNGGNGDGWLGQTTGGGAGGGSFNDCSKGSDGSAGAVGGAGTAGTIGTLGSFGSHISGFWVPGGQGGAGSDGIGGSGGKGGGGGAGQGDTGTAICTDGAGSGGGGGGGGGEGGTGGTGGSGGGSSYAVYLFNNGVNAYFEDCNLTSGVVGPGGAGGAGGTGGGGGAAGAGNPYTGGEVGAGGNGGAGGTGGSGGSGGIGSAGETIGLYINGGTAPTLMDTSFNLAVQPTITMDDVNCTYTDIDYMTAVSNTWGFGVGSIPQNLTGDTVTTQYDTISRKDILYGSEIYTGFANILFDGAPVSITVVSAGGAINLCAGDSILLTATSGYTNYQWMQNDTDIVGATDSLLWVNDSGAYTVKVLTTCCGIGIAKDTIDVDVYPLPIADAGLDTTICNGFSVTLSGSGADFYSWSPAATLDSSTLQNPTATPPDTTTYVLIVSDTIGCNDVDTVTVNVNPNPIVVVDTFDVSCNGQNDGSAMANPSGSTSPYLYQWDDNNNQINQTATGLPPGVYHVTVTDSNTCATVDSVLITEPTLLTATEDSTNATCYGGCDGTAVYTLSGGTPAYSYAWSDGQSGSVAIGLCAGTYIVTAQDSNSCLSIGIFEITQPPQMTSTTDSTDALCGLPTGSATVTITSGGQSPFNYQWDNNAFNQITQIATGLLGGTYSVTVTDQMGCFIVETITVIDPPAVNATMDAIAETCGESNGVAIISAMNGGTPPFTYQWDASAGNQTGTIATGLAGGTYEVIITDNLGCADTTTVTVPSVGFLDADFDADPIQGLEPLEVEFEDESTGTIDSYSWDFQGDTDSSQSPTYIFQNDGEYNVVLTIANSYGCVDTASMLIIVDALSDLELPNVFSPNGDGINDVFIVKALAMQEVEVTIMSRWGQLMAYWNDLATGFWDGRTPSGLEAPEGTYFVVVKATGNDYDKPYLETKTLTLVR